MTGDAPRERLARRAAQDLLREVAVAGLPVDPFDIAKHKKPPLLLVERDLPDDIYGACGLVNGQFAIAVCKACPTPGHRRFTAAHELGHYHIEGHIDRLFAGEDRWVPSKGAHFQANADPVEREADFFASELLMPEVLVAQLLKGRPSLRQVRAVAASCDVSLSSAAITVARLTHDPLAILVSHDGVLEWPAFSKALTDYPWARTRVKGEWAPPGSGTKRLATDGRAVLASGEDGGEGLLCEWFPGAPAWAKVEEEAVGLGAYGRVLTVLRPGPLPDRDAEQERSWRRSEDRFDDEDDDA